MNIAKDLTELVGGTPLVRLNRLNLGVAEVLLKLARATYVFMDTQLKPSSVITYHITNVPQLNSSLSKDSEEQIKYLELLQKLQDTGMVDVEGEIQKVYEKARKMIADV